jgi:hypothetical protein
MSDDNLKSDNGNNNRNVNKNKNNDPMVMRIAHFVAKMRQTWKAHTAFFAHARS